MRLLKSIVKILANSDETLVLDGGMGTEIERRGIILSSPLWSSDSKISPSLVSEIHHEYLKAGADIIETNTFRASTYILEKSGLDSDVAFEIISAAIGLAVAARESHGHCFIFGSVAPLEDCFRPDLVPSRGILIESHSKTLSFLDSSPDIDLILCETQNTFQEIETLLEVLSDRSHPSGLSVTLNSKGNLLDGKTSWAKLLRIINDSSLEFFGVNCSAPDTVTKSLMTIAPMLEKPLAVYANVGYSDPIDYSQNDFPRDPRAYLEEAKKWLRAGARILGGCCGTTPSHIAELVSFLRSNYRFRKPNPFYRVLRP